MGDPLAPRLPASLLDASRSEVTDATLCIVEGALPAELRGHLFVVAPASTVAWGGRPRPGQPPLLNGDGMICRVDFDGGAARATCRLARSPCQIADELTHSAPFPASILQFLDAGIARLSPLLGARDFLNTAFVPLVQPGQAPRLLLTYDAGRPYEIDPQTLRVIGPMGAAAEWVPEVFGGAPFPMILSAGHPFWDPRTGELFTINYGRSLESMGPHPERIDWLGPHFWDHQGGAPESFTHLVRWNGSGALEHWQLVGPDGQEVQITQSVHQVAVTRNWIVLFDTAFRVGFEQWFNDPFPGSHTTEELLRALLARPQNPYTSVWLVPRAALGQGSTDPTKPTPIAVTATTVPVEAAHLLADYDDSDGRVTIHLAHSAASDLAEWVRPYDVSYYDGAAPRASVEGMVAIGAMDINRIGRYRIDGKTGAIVESGVVYDDRLTWTLALYAGRELPAVTAAPERLEHIFWSSAGFFPELLTKFVHGLYADYSHRVTPLAEIQALAKEGGRPSSLIRIDTAAMKIADSYAAPTGAIIASPQFVARGDGPLEGWIVSTVYTPARAELWWWDAARLAAGPICRLDASALGIGFSLHTAWLPSLAARTATYRIDLAADVGGRGGDHDGVRDLLAL
ncbi:MAG TPA: carotenoid oxygenase family protein, partial [Polyangia bacterium]|nr:carotenoid oxygenase family protein [Polyangia bacterium]